MELSRGDRIEVIGLMEDEPCPIAVGTTGTVIGQTGVGTALEQTIVSWDEGPDKVKRTLLLVPADYHVIRVIEG